ncbi:MAG: hypothetical protein ACD_21C00190G0003 [uncultured bacterium]|nr:MAG: hypothetical protein ACD_21C00190G0003 [uncultured bacterium]
MNHWYYFLENKHKTEQLLFAERLNHALDIFGIPPKGRGRQLVVAKMFNVSQKGASKWLEGKTFPEIGKIKTIAERLNINIEWLLTGSNYINIEDLPSPGKSSMKRIPLLQWKDATNWNHIGLNQNTRWGWADAEISPCAFALQICDDSMLPRYEIGAIIVIDPEEKPKHRNLVIAQKSNGEVICRQLLIDGDKRYLKPSNLKYPAYLIGDKENKIEIIGAIRQVFMKVS